MAYEYHSSMHCNALTNFQSSMKMQISDTIEHIRTCQEHCNVAQMNISCSALPANPKSNSLYQSMIKVSFDILVGNPHADPMPPSCGQLCKRQDLRRKLVKGERLKNAIERLVNTNAEQLKPHILNDTELSEGSFQSFEEQTVCQDGRVFTEGIACG